jgi:hypothetical protein
MDLKKLFAALALAAAPPLAAQEPWDVHLKLTAGVLKIAVDNQLGQNRAYGLGIAGAYKLTLQGYGTLEGGYKVLPTTSVTSGLQTIDDRTEIYFVGAGYRYEIWRNGLYAQGGLRASGAKTIRDIIVAKPDGGKEREKEKADRRINVGWCLGLGFRLTELWSVELGASSLAFQNVAGKQPKGMLIEASLCVHR